MTWTIVSLGDVCERVSVGHVGITSEFYTDNSGIPFLRTQNLNSDGLVLNDIKYITKEFHDRLKKSTLAEGDVILSRVISTSINCGIVPPELNGANCANIILARPRKGSIDSKYLLYYLRSEDIQRRLLSRQVGSAQSVVNTGVLKEWEIPLPSLTEQKRIAAILDKADAIRRKRQQAIQLADEFLRAVFLDMFGDPVTNPKGWEVKALKDISRIQIGPFGTQLHKEDYVHGGIPLINPTHIVKGHIFPKDNLTITAEKHESLPEYHLNVGDIIMGRRGEMGRCAVVGENEKGFLCGTGSLFIRPEKKGFFSEYLNKLLASEAIKSHLESESQGATMPNLNKTIVGNIQVPIPKDRVLNQFANVKQKIINTRMLYAVFSDEKFFESVSSKSFSGRL